MTHRYRRIAMSERERHRYYPASHILPCSITMLTHSLYLKTRQLWVCMLFLAVLTLVACDYGIGTYRMGTSVQEQAYSELGSALQRELRRRGRLNLEIVETKGSVENLRLLRDGKLDFALVQGGFSYDDEDLLSVAAVDTEYLHILVPVSSEIKDLSDLGGKRVAAGIQGTGSHRVIEQIAEIARFNPPLKLIPTTRQSIAEQFYESNVDAAMFVTSLQRELEPLLATGRFRLVGISAADALDMLLFDVQSALIAKGIYGQNLAFPPIPTPTLAVKTNLLVRKDIPNQAVTRVIEALFDHRVRRDARLLNLTEVAGRSGVALSLHPAAEAYYSRNDPITSDQFEIAAFFLAALVALVGAIRLFLLWYRRRGTGSV